MRINDLPVPRHIRPMPVGLTQTRYGRFKDAPETRIKTVFDRVKKKVDRTFRDWGRNRYFEVEND